MRSIKKYINKVLYRKMRALRKEILDRNHTVFLLGCDAIGHSAFENMKSMDRHRKVINKLTIKHNLLRSLILKY